MSHLSTISLEIDSLDILAKTARSFGGQLVRDQKTYEWYSSRTNLEDSKCDHAIKLPNCKYEIGVVKTPKNKYELKMDFWYSGGLEKVIGKDGGLFKQKYTDFRTEQELKMKKLKFKRTVDEKNNVQYEILM
jgi:hypothetical protein